MAEPPELLTPAEMARADAMAIAAGVAGIDLMERAGRAVAQEACAMAPPGGRIAILCGPGKNGGDGFVAARHLAAQGFAVELGLIGKRAALRGDAGLAAGRWSGAILAPAAMEFAGTALVIDALFGAGLTRPLDGEAALCVARINAFAAAGGKVLSVDLPSGLEGASGQANGPCVRASASVTFFRLKPGHVLLPGRALCGRVVLKDIGISAAVLGPIASRTTLNAPVVWRAAMPQLNAASHKYSRGVALVLSGPAHRTGAARLAARAALRAGAGLVALASPLDAVAINAAHETAVMIEPFDGVEGFRILLRDERRNVLVLGPGAGVGVETRAIVAAALAGPTQASRAVVLDADALTNFAGDAASLQALIKVQERACIITPHDGEFARLFAAQSEIAALPDRLSRTRAAAAFLGAIVVSKGADCVVADPRGRATIGYDLPPSLATAGSGDVLAGLIAGLLAQAMPPFEAASAAVWLHGAAARAFGPGLIAQDLPDALPTALRELAALSATG